MNKRTVNTAKPRASLPTTISHAHINALERIGHGGDMCEGELHHRPPRYHLKFPTVKQKFYLNAQKLILAAMHEFKKQLGDNEPHFTIDKARYMFQQLLGATENMFEFTRDAYVQTA
ncbi:hypothetical protein BT96DRAFT_1007508 [Gymnopus androsaceus JB14]|uniref:Uncharacterized protein n=1 Tax=Gymnopus androsaceus JB14 TaxID=1447944 RepID=A0A6A4GH71_9AGAR|nr:hypothetical protein BT96DRAFT_1007508 [Gymnopus androsaceus JB14]